MAKKKGPLRTFRINGFATVDVVADVMATSEKDAREKFHELSTPGLCHQCSKAGEGRDDTVTLNGMSDETTITEVEDLGESSNS